MNPMHRRTFHIPDELHEAVKRHAAELGISESEFLRQSLYVRIAWTNAVRAVSAGCEPGKLVDYDVMQPVLERIASEFEKENGT